MEERKKVIYISGPITGVDKYWEEFERAEDMLAGMGYIPLSPAHLPQGMSEAAYMRISMAMLDSADAVAFLPNAHRSRGSRIERDYCGKVGKPVVLLYEDDWRAEPRGQYPPEIVEAWLKYNLREALGE